LRGAVDCCSDWASVLQTTNSHPIRFDRIILLTAFHGGAGGADDGNARLKLVLVFRDAEIDHSVPSGAC